MIAPAAALAPPPPPPPPPPPLPAAVAAATVPRRMRRWWQVNAGALSGVLIAAALALVFIAGFTQTSSSPTAPAVRAAPAGQRAPQLPATSNCLSTRAHRCPRSPTQTAKPSPGPARTVPK